MRNLLFIALLPCLCAAADAPPSFDRVVQMTRAVPGEFAADALIRMAALPSVDTARKVKLLEQAFQRAAKSQEPLKRQPAILRVPGAAGFLNRAFAQDLDAMSLRLRVVAAMEPIDRKKARRLFEKIPAPAIPKLRCADFMVYNVAAYYDALERLEPAKFVVKRAAAMTSPVQIVPLARVLMATPDDADFRAELEAYATALGKISGDDRAFTFVRNLGPLVAQIVEECKKRNIPSVSLVENYRRYLVNNEATARCADDELLDATGERQMAMTTGAAVTGGEGVNFFNTRLRVDPLKPIQEQEATPTKLEGVAEGLSGCRDAACEAFVKQYNALMIDPDTNTLRGPKDKSSPYWVGDLRKLLADLAAWKPAAGITPAQFYRQKCAYYTDLLGMAPAGPLQEETVKAMVTFVAENGFQANSHIEWFLPLNVLLARITVDPLGVGKYAAYARNSKDPIVSLYTALEAVAPRSPAEIMSLL